MGERNISVWLPLVHAQMGTGPHPSMCPDWESNGQPFGSRASTQSTEPPHQPGLGSLLASILRCTPNFCSSPDSVRTLAPLVTSDFEAGLSVGRITETAKA